MTDDSINRGKTSKLPLQLQQLFSENLKHHFSSALTKAISELQLLELDFKDNAIDFTKPESVYSLDRTMFQQVFIAFVMEDLAQQIAMDLDNTTSTPDSANADDD